MPQITVPLDEQKLDAFAMGPQRYYVKQFPGSGPLVKLQKLEETKRILFEYDDKDPINLCLPTTSVNISKSKTYQLQ